MVKQDMIHLGIPKLDDLLGGGIRKGFTMAISSVPGTNIEVIIKQMASEGNPVYITTNETKDEIISTMNEFSWKSSSIEFEDIAQQNLDHILAGETKRVSIHQQRSKNLIKDLIKAGSQGLPSMKRSEDDYLAVISNMINQSADRKIIIHSLDFFLEQHRIGEVIHSLKAGKMKVAQGNGLLIFTYTRDIHDIGVERQLELLADCLIELDVIWKGSSLERVLSVKKMRNLGKKFGTVHYDIDEQGFVLEEIDRIL